MLVQDVMTRKVVTVNPDVAVSDAAGVMNTLQIGSIVAAQKERIAGILTERDILSKIVIPGKDARKTRVRDVMTSPVKTIGPERSVDEAADIMSISRIRRLPVVKDHELLGIVTSSDIVRIYLDVDKVIREIAVKDAEEIKARAKKFASTTE